MCRFYKVIFAFMFFLAPQWGRANFPERPIEIVVYTNPGGAIDVFARKFQKVASKYTSATFVVVNKVGAGGLIAMKHIARARHSDYMIGAITKSVLGKIASSSSGIDLNQYHWLASMDSDPEAIIVNSESSISTWDAMVKDAKDRPGEQLWVGPASGGNDHIMATKLWKELGIKAKWIPYTSGGKAMAALMGQQGVVYVGNPSDVLGKGSLKIVAISSPKRLTKKFKDVPTLKELGVSGLDQEIIWRGFIASKKMKPEAIKFYNDLLEKVNKDPEWIRGIEDGGARADLILGQPFKDLAEKDLAEFKEALKNLSL